MSKRKPATASKRALSSHKLATASKRSRGPKVAARAQRNKQAFVRSTKESTMRSVAADPTETPIRVHSDSKQGTRIAEARAAALQAILQAALQDGFSQKVVDDSPKKGFDFSSLTTNMQAYQAKLLEVIQVNMQFSFEFGQRLATTRSPFEFLAVVVEFTGRRILMIGKHSKEMAAYSLWRTGA